MALEPDGGVRNGAVESTVREAVVSWLRAVPMPEMAGVEIFYTGAGWTGGPLYLAPGDSGGAGVWRVPGLREAVVAFLRSV
jgi:hypothetical protein